MSKKAYAEGQKQQKQGLKAADQITSKRLAKYFSEKQLDFAKSRQRSTPCRRSWNMFTFPRLYSWMSGVIVSQQVFTHLPRIQIRWWLPCFPGSLKRNLVKTALSSSTEMELTFGLYLIIFVMVSRLYQKVQHFWKNLQTDEAEFSRSKEFWRSWRLKHRRILKNQWFWQMKSTESSFMVRCLSIASCKVIRIPESRKFLLVESGILGIGIQNPAFGIQNPAKEWIQNLFA